MAEQDSFLKVQIEVGDLQKMYDDNPRTKSFTAIILGASGSGKSFLLRTARKPIHYDSFDPGGTKNLRKWVDKGEIVADVRWEEEDPENPTVFLNWEKETKRRIQEGYFNHFGSYVIDSATTWSDSIMNQILKAAGLAGHPPRWAHDYVPQKIKIHNWVKRLMKLPCDFYMTGHLAGSKDDVTGRMYYEFMTTGKGAITLPLLFDEIYVMLPKETSSGVEYRILTKATGTYTARSRLAEDGKLDTYEKPDIKHILKKAGFPCVDKPIFKRGEK